MPQTLESSLPVRQARLRVVASMDDVVRSRPAKARRPQDDPGS